MIKKALKKLPALVMGLAATIILLSSTGIEAREQRVYDQSGLLSEQEVAQLEEKIAGLKATLLLDLVIVTIDDAEGKSSRDFADDFYDYGGFGMGSDYDGLLYLINMDNREAYITTTGAAIDIFTDARIDAMLDHMYIYLVDGDYYRSGTAFLDDVLKYARQGVPERQHRIDESEMGWTARLKRSLSNTPVYLLLSMMIGAVAVGIMASRNRGTVKTTAATYLNKNVTNLIHSHDQLINTHVSKVKIHTPPSGGSSGSSFSGSRSTTHTSSSGRTHGGGGRKF
jgi:uncharacterized protein